VAPKATSESERHEEDARRPARGAVRRRHHLRCACALCGPAPPPSHHQEGRRTKNPRSNNGLGPSFISQSPCRAARGVSTASAPAATAAAAAAAAGTGTPHNSNTSTLRSACVCVCGWVSGCGGGGGASWRATRGGSRSENLLEPLLSVKKRTDEQAIWHTEYCARAYSI
jgi:hypothetical protein